MQEKLIGRTFLEFLILCKFQTVYVLGVRNLAPSLFSNNTEEIQLSDWEKVENRGKVGKIKLIHRSKK